MTIPKRTRYEVLRRDNYTCRYCGARAPDVRLNVDAVVPEALGGNHKDPANLVTACEACNNGKSSSHPDAPLVAEVADDAVRWAAAMRAASAKMLADIEGRQADRDQFRKWWDNWTYTEDGRQHTVPVDGDWESTVDQFLAAGLPLPVLKICIDGAMRRKRVGNDHKFRYMCGIAWRKVRELRECASGMLHGEPAEVDDGDDGGDEEEELYARGADDWCRVILKQRDADDVAKASRDCRNRAGDESPGGVLWFVINNVESDRSALYTRLRELLETLPDEVGIDLIRQQEAYWLDRAGPSGRYTALASAADWTIEHFALIRARKELAAMPADEAAAWVQRARDENTEIAEHLDENYYLIEGAQRARGVFAEKSGEARALDGANPF